MYFEVCDDFFFSTSIALFVISFNQFRIKTLQKVNPLLFPMSRRGFSSAPAYGNGGGGEEEGGEESTNQRAACKENRGTDLKGRVVRLAMLRTCYSDRYGVHIPRWFIYSYDLSAAFFFVLGCFWSRRS